MKNFNKILFACLFLCGSIIPFLGESSNNQSNQTISWATTDGLASNANLVKMENASLKGFYSNYYLDNESMTNDYTSYEANIPGHDGLTPTPGNIISKGFDQTLNPNGDILHNGFLTWMPSSWSWLKYTPWSNYTTMTLNGYQPTLLQPKIVLQGITTTPSPSNSQEINYDFQWGIQWGIQAYYTSLITGYSYDKPPYSLFYKINGYWTLLLKQENIVSHMTYNQVTQNISNSGLQASYAGMTQIYDSWSDQTWNGFGFDQLPGKVDFNAPATNEMSEHQFQAYSPNNNIPQTQTPKPLIQTSNFYFGDTPWLFDPVRDNVLPNLNTLLLNFLQTNFQNLPSLNLTTITTWAMKNMPWNESIFNLVVKSVDVSKSSTSTSSNGLINLNISFTYLWKTSPNTLIKSSIQLLAKPSFFPPGYLPF